MRPPLKPLSANSSVAASRMSSRVASASRSRRLAFAAGCRPTSAPSSRLFLAYAQGVSKHSARPVCLSRHNLFRNLRLTFFVVHFPLQQNRIALWRKPREERQLACLGRETLGCCKRVGSARVHATRSPSSCFTGNAL